MIRVALVATAAALLAAAPAAPAATVTTDQRCYADPSVRKDRVEVTGSGFDPAMAFSATLDDKALTTLTGMSDPMGMLRGDFATPPLPKGHTQKSYTLAVRTGGQVAKAVFAISSLSASYSPQTSSLRGKVAFHLRGFALSGASHPTVYLHYVSPKGVLHTTVALGRTQGSCGRLESGRRALFGFTPSRGSWRLQFDTSRAYRKGSPAGAFLYYVIRLDVS